MQYLPGFTVQCINPLCEARGHWLRADFTTPLGSDGHCPCCGDFLRNVPPPPAPRFRMRPPSLTPRPPPPPPPPSQIWWRPFREHCRELFYLFGPYFPYPSPSRPAPPS